MKLLRLIFLSLLTMPLWADYHPDINWFSIKTEHFNIIFDERIEEDANHIANRLENYYLSISNNMGEEIDRYTLVLPAEMVISNGYVSSLNNKSVFYPTPPTDSFAGAINWYDLLSIHETRHMTQYSHIRNSTGQRILEFLFGSYGYIGAMLIPSYFYEGDAVLTETLLSNSGRGRSPDFERGLRTLLLTDKDYSFSKALLGSQKDYYPNYYVLGYYLMTYLEREYEDNILSDIADDAGNNPFPLNFSAATMINTGKSMPRVYKEVTKELKALWEEQDSKVVPSEISLLTDDFPEYRNLTYGKIDKEDRLFYLETILNDETHLVIKDNDTFVTIENVNDQYSVSGSDIIYSKYSTDPRWLYRGFSDIYKYNINNGKEIKLTEDSRYFIPVFSSDGKKIATVESSIDRTASLVLLDSTTGEIIHKKEFKEFDSISGLSWNDNNTKLVFTGITNNGSVLVVYDFLTDKYNFISNVDYVNKSRPLFYNNYVLFISSYSGINNVNAINLETGLEYQVLSSRFGADYPSLKDDKLIFSDYTSDGYKINSFNLDPTNWIDITLVDKNHVDYFSPLLSTVQPPLENNIKYDIKEYDPNAHLIDVHSWIVNPFSPVLQKSDVFDIYNDSIFDVSELVLYSNDNLEYLDSTFYTHFNNRSGAFDIGGFGTYRGLYPRILWDINFFVDDVETGLTSLSTTFNFMFNLNYIDSSFTLGVIPNYFLSIDGNEDDSLDLTYYMSYSLIINDFYITPTVLIDQYILNDSYFYLGITSDIKTPGFFIRDGFSIYSESLWELNDDYILSGSNITKPQSAVLDLDEELGESISYLNIEYNLPIFSPDLSIFNWVYFNSIDLYTGYEAFASEYITTKQVVSGRISLSYYLLRVPLNFYSDFTLYYDIDETSWNYRYNILSFNLGDL